MANSNGSEMPDSVQDYKLPPWREYKVKPIDFENYQEDEALFNDINTRNKELLMWEVFHGEVRDVDSKEHFKFYNNRAYIVLSDKEFQKPDGQTSRCCHIHIWISKFCSGKDYKLAVVRAEQLEKKLDVKPFLHREIELHETDVFHNHDAVVEVRRTERIDGESPVHHLLQFRVEETAHGVNATKSTDTTSKRLKRKWMIERMILRGNLCSDDVFVLKNYGELRVFQWNGKNSNKENEQTMAAKYIKQEQEKFSKTATSQLEKKLTKVDVYEGVNDKNHYMYSLILKLQSQVKSGSFDGTAAKLQRIKSSTSFEGNAPKDSQKNNSNEKFKRLYRLTDDSGHFIMENPVEDHRTISKNSFLSEFVYLLDTDYIAYVWIGEDWVCPDESQGRLNQILDAVDRHLVPEYIHCGQSDRFHQPVNKPITLVDENDHYLPFVKLLRD